MLRFPIRDLFWLAALVGLAMGWYLEHARLIEVRNYARSLRYQFEIARYRHGPMIPPEKIPLVNEVDWDFADVPVP